MTSFEAINKARKELGSKIENIAQGQIELRDYLAGQMLASAGMTLLHAQSVERTNGGTTMPSEDDMKHIFKVVAGTVYAMADAMLERREVKR